MSEIKQLFDQLQEFKLLPVNKWHPNKSLDIGLHITANGEWYYQGSLIQRQRLVKLFCSVLRLERDGCYFLVTPQLKYPVAVDDAPFQAVELSQQGVGPDQNLIFRTNVNDVVLADRDHPIEVRVNPESGQPSPYVEVRDGLKAKICRSVYYELAQLLQPVESNGKHARDENPQSDNTQANNVRGDREVVGVYSAGQFFPFGSLK